MVLKHTKLDQWSFLITSDMVEEQGLREEILFQLLKDVHDEVLVLGAVSMDLKFTEVLNQKTIRRTYLDISRVIHSDKFGQVNAESVTICRQKGAR